MSDEPREITMNSIPGMPVLLFKTATCRKPKQQQAKFLPIKVSARGIKVDTRKLGKFRKVCGFSAGEILPLTYPHIMAFALHLQLMLEPEFPFIPAGAVHIRNRIRQQRAINVDETLDFCAAFKGAEQVDKGYEVTIITEVRIKGELVWDDCSVMLIRKGGTGVKKEKQKSTETPAYNESITWQLASNKGRQYAAASGDYNPIHLFPITAKLMGFKRHIMHGMWSKSRAVAHLLPTDYRDAVSVDVSFKLPVFLPATVTLMVNKDENVSQFEMKDGKGEKPHLAGELSLGKGIEHETA